MEKVKTLLLSGENNHDWKRSTPYLKELLEKTGRFYVDVTLDPSKTLSDRNKMEKYQLIFTDYNGPEWEEKAKTNFVSAVNGGAGLFVLHAANNSFAEWKEYRQMLGVTFAENVSGHGDFHEFEVTRTEAGAVHPITKDIPNFKTWDELYHRTVSEPGINYTVLAEAYSAPEKGGTGKYEPMMIVNHFGKGRIFHYMLGHVWPEDFGGGYLGYQMLAYNNVQFQRCLVRGAEWAATGQVNPDIDTI